jgi:hypothetical protein
MPDVSNEGPGTHAGPSQQDRGGSAALPESDNRAPIASTIKPPAPNPLPDDAANEPAANELSPNERSTHEPIPNEPQTQVMQTVDSGSKLGMDVRTEKGTNDSVTEDIPAEGLAEKQSLEREGAARGARRGARRGRPSRVARGGKGGDDQATKGNRSSGSRSSEPAGCKVQSVTQTEESDAGRSSGTVRRSG